MLEPADKEHIRTILHAEGIDNEKPYIAITTRYLHDDMPTWVKTQLGYSTGSAQDSYDALASIFKKLTEKYQLVIIPMHPELQEDYNTADMLFSQCDSNHFVLKKRYTPFEVIGIFQGSEFSIQSRLGSTVFSVLAGSPFLAISYEPRMSNWMKAHGLSEYCVDWCDIKADELLGTIHTLSDCTDNLRENFEALKIDQKNLFISQSENIFSELTLVKNR
jgi:polysaccharide pyruvyl transferase WcaK-like protein